MCNFGTPTSETQVLTPPQPHYVGAVWGRLQSHSPRAIDTPLLCREAAVSHPRDFATHLLCKMDMQVTALGLLTPLCYARGLQCHTLGGLLPRMLCKWNGRSQPSGERHHPAMRGGCRGIALGLNPPLGLLCQRELQGLNHQDRSKHPLRVYWAIAIWLFS